MLGRTIALPLEHTHRLHSNNYVTSYCRRMARDLARHVTPPALDPYFRRTRVADLLHFDKDRFDRVLRSTTFRDRAVGIVFQGRSGVSFRRFDRLQAVEIRAAPRSVIDPQGYVCVMRAAYGRFTTCRTSSLQRLAGARRTATTSVHECDLDNPWASFPAWTPFRSCPSAHAVPNFAVYATGRSISRRRMRTVKRGYQASLEPTWRQLHLSRHRPASAFSNETIRRRSPGTCGAGPWLDRANSNQRARSFERERHPSGVADLIEIVTIAVRLYKGRCCLRSAGQ